MEEISRVTRVPVDHLLRQVGAFHCKVRGWLEAHHAPSPTPPHGSFPSSSKIGADINAAVPLQLGVEGEVQELLPHVQVPHPAVLIHLVQDCFSPR